MRVSVHDEVSQVLVAHKQQIKGEYLTYAMFVDSAVRAKLRRMGIDAGEDAIIGHLKKKQAGRLRHLDRADVQAAIRRHQHRINQARKVLDEMDV